MNKYEFTGETKELAGLTLHRIRALRSFADVEAGELGGWIERKENLSQDGLAWVYGNAWVYGDAWVRGGRWEESPLYIPGTVYPFNVASNELVRCGCQIHTWQEWHDRYLAIARANHAEGIVAEYVQHFNRACQMYGHEDCIIGAGG